MKLFYDISLVDDRGQVHGRIVRELSEDAAYFGNRIVDEMRIGLVPFEHSVKVMHKKEFRRNIMKTTAVQCSMALCDFLEDREGWHGMDKQDTAERLHLSGGRS